MSQTTFKVSPAFIIKAHGVACTEWKTKLEVMYPEVFKPGKIDTTFKQGDKVQFPQPSRFPVTYVLASFAHKSVGLISMQDGNRWSEAVKVENVKEITVEEMKKICDGQPLETILVNGTTPTLASEPSTDKTLNADRETILEAYKQTSSTEIRDMIKAEFPSVIQGYVMLVKGNSLEGHTFTIDTGSSLIDGVTFMIGYGLAPTQDLKYSCIAVYDSECEVEIVKENSMTFVAFKKKF